MITIVRRSGLAALAGLALLGVAAPAAHAQRRLPSIPSLAAQSINQNPYITPSLSLNQYAHNTAVLGQALSNVPPYLLGYNPYPQMVNYGPSYPMVSPYGGSNLSTMGAYNPSLGGGYGATLATNPYLGGSGSSGYGSPGSSGYGGGYGYPYSINPFNGYLTGAAGVTTANANYQLTTQQARLEREKANQEHMQTRRKIIEEAEWERGRQPDPEKVREADIEAQLNRARRDPPLTEVWSARSLNALLNHLAAQKGQLAKGPAVPLDEETLKSINLTPGDSRANAGLLKDDGKLQWPRPLQGEEFSKPRTRLSRLLEEAVQKLKFNPNTPVPQGLVKDMKNDLGALTNLLNDSVSDLSPSQYIEAKRYLNQVGDAVAALSDPKVGVYFNPNWPGKARNVAELVSYMNKSGLRFAAATPGDEPAYNALYRALADFDAAMPQAAKSPPPSSPRE
jgi:hypothetical protein